jgi:hypothetical protein
MNMDNDYLNVVLSSDESKFTNHGAVNRHNCNYYSQNNVCWIRHTYSHSVISVNVWCGIVEKYIRYHFFKLKIVMKIVLF